MIDREEIARQRYERDFGTEAARDEWIAKRAAEIMAHLDAVVGTDIAESECIGALALSIISDSAAGAMVRLRTSSNPTERSGTTIIFDGAVAVAMKREAEHRATLEAEAMTPNDYLPD